MLLTTEEDMHWRLNVGHGLFSPVSQPVSALGSMRLFNFGVSDNCIRVHSVSMLSRRPRYRSD